VPGHVECKRPKSERLKLLSLSGLEKKHAPHM
jgi:hypothetical protein